MATIWVSFLVINRMIVSVRKNKIGFWSKLDTWAYFYMKPSTVRHIHIKRDSVHETFLESVTFTHTSTPIQSHITIQRKAENFLGIRWFIEWISKAFQLIRHVWFFWGIHTLRYGNRTNRHLATPFQIYYIASLLLFGCCSSHLNRFRGAAAADDDVAVTVFGVTASHHALISSTSVGIRSHRPLFWNERECFSMFGHRSRMYSFFNLNNGTKTKWIHQIVQLNQRIVRVHYSY